MYTLQITWKYWEKEKRQMVVEVDDKSYPVENGKTVDIQVEQGFHNIAYSLILANGKKSPMAKVYTSITRNESVTIDTKSFFSAWTISGTLPGQKSKVVAALLALFTGQWGIHRFYLGDANRGVMMPLLWFAGLMMSAGGNGMGVDAFALIGNVLSYGVVVFALIDFIRILMGILKPNNGTDYKGKAPMAVQVVQPVVNKAVPVSSASTSNDQMEALEKLAKLHAQGILTDEEFQQKKKELLERL